MKIKFGDLTVRQAKELCEKREKCYGCPIQVFCEQIFDSEPWKFSRLKLEIEIDLPDDEVKDDEALHNRV